MSKVKITIDKIGLLLVIVFAVLTFLLIIFNFSENEVFNPPGLRLLFNTIFIALVNITLAAVSLRSFLRYGQISSVLLANALIVSGLAAFFSGWASEISANANFTIFNIGMLISSIMQAFGAVYLSASPNFKVSSNKKSIIVLSLSASIVSVLLLTALTVFGFISPFISDIESLPLRQFVVGLTFLFFALASIIFGYQYFRSKARALYWYSLALALLAIDALVSFNSTELGSILQWVGRVAYYLSGLYFVGVLLALRQQTENGTGFLEKWFETFSGNRRQFAALFSNMLSGFAYLRIVTDKDGKVVDFDILEVNDAFEMNTALKKTDVVGKHITQVISNVEKEPLGWVDVLGRVGLTGEPARFEKYAERLQKWFKVSAYSPEKGYVVALFDDITERKSLENELEEYSKHLEGLVKERTEQLKNAERLATIGQTAGMVGHDIRNPLQAIVSDLYLVKAETKNVVDPESKQSLIESIDSINQNIAYINKIVTDLQDYARKTKPIIEEVDLESIIQKILAEIKIPKNIKVNYFLDPNNKLKTDPSYIRRILTNLITNAIRAMPNGGKLTIEVLSVDSDKTGIIVADTGEGISKEVQDKLFKPLFTTKAKGQGFGLAVVKKFVEELDGTISFESEVGKGTKFIINLPTNNLSNQSLL